MLQKYEQLSISIFLFLLYIHLPAPDEGLFVSTELL